MPGPPITVQIKRKATDDPVDLLHVQNDVDRLRQRKQYVFKRQRTSLATNKNAHASITASSFDTTQPAISFTGTNSWTNMQSSPIEKAQKTQTPELGNDSDHDTPALSRHSGGIGPQESLLDKPIPHSALKPRHFHLSRSPTPQSLAGGLSNGARGARRLPTIFIEQPLVKLGTTAPKLDGSASEQSSVNDSKSQTLVTEPNSLSSKAQQRLPAPLRNTRLPSGKVIPWNADASQLTAEMQAYTMQEIGHNLNEMSRPASGHPSGPMLKPRQVSRFKPKPQKPRYNEPPAEQTTLTNEDQQSRGDEAMADVEDEFVEESSYVMDVYIRMPAEMFNMEEQKSVGVLVLESQPDIDQFYNDDSDSDSEIFDEEEDENAENHPSTDYPEDEVESDDEYGRNPYRYRNSNISDDEEFDLTYSDDDEGEEKPPWARRPWMTKPTHGEKDDDADEDY